MYFSTNFRTFLSLQSCPIFEGARRRPKRDLVAGSFPQATALVHVPHPSNTPWGLSLLLKFCWTCGLAWLTHDPEERSVHIPEFNKSAADKSPTALSFVAGFCLLAVPRIRRSSLPTARKRSMAQIRPREVCRCTEPELVDCRNHFGKGEAIHVRWTIRLWSVRQGLRQIHVGNTTARRSRDAPRHVPRAGG